MLIPGASGEKVQMPDGAQLDHLSENTVSHGVSIAGRTSGVAIEAGYVGEKVSGTITQAISLGTSETTVSSDLDLSAGIWDIVFALPVYMATGATSGNAVEVVTGIYYGPGNTQEGNRVTGSIKTVANVSMDSRMTFSGVINVSFSGANRQYRIRSAYSGAGGGASSIGNAGGMGWFYAIRRA